MRQTSFMVLGLNSFNSISTKFKSLTGISVETSKINLNGELRRIPDESPVYPNHWSNSLMERLDSCMAKCLALMVFCLKSTLSKLKM